MKEHFTNTPEPIFKSERPTVSRELTLQSSVKRHDHFSLDGNDEFQITRENGQQQGIFKVWAPPIIPELEGISATEWCEHLHTKPLSLLQSLEQWRSFSDLADRRLQLIFEKRVLPDNPQPAMVELFLRMKLAFSFASPFYHLEALVADSRAIKTGNPVDFKQQEIGGGKLDLVAMALPSALENLLIADKLNWNSISWELLKDQVRNLKQSFLEGKGGIAADQFRLITQVANTAGIKPEEVLFVANALQFIPVSVGGKRGDLGQSEALAMLAQAMKTSVSNISTSSVAQEINALIRFLNWTTSVQSPDNFKGKFWRYDAVCATAGTLLELIKQHPTSAFNQEFSEIFVNFLAPQLDNLDATSAKGRFLMQLLSEGKFKTAITEGIAAHTHLFNSEIATDLEEIQQNELFLPLTECLSTFLVGGKSVGIARAKQILPEQFIHEGIVISSEAIGMWLERIPTLKHLIERLNSPISVDQKILIGHEIMHQISNSEVPSQLWQGVASKFGGKHRIVLRSSSFDEDVDSIGPAPGIYESVVEIDPRSPLAVQAALKTVVSSFFSEKAIGFREMKGLRHFPVMAVIAQEFIDAPGGSVFIEGGKIDLNVALNPSQINTVGTHFERHEFDSKTENSTPPESQLLSNQQIEAIFWIAQQSEKVLGPSDIEFVIDPKTMTVKVLQLRSLKKQSLQTEDDQAISATTTLVVDNLETLPVLEHDAINLKISQNIDLEKFQGQLFRWIITHSTKIVEITMSEEIPRTCHFANIISCLGIKLTVVT